MNPNSEFRTVVVNSAKPAVVIVFDVDRNETDMIGHGPVPISESFLDPVHNDLYYYFKNGKGEVLKLGRASQDPTAVQRLAVLVRDRHCQYPGCTAPGEIVAKFTISTNGSKSTA